MNRSKADAIRSLAIAEREAEDRAIAYLSTLHADVARDAALKVALLFFAEMEVESETALSDHAPDPTESMKADERRMLASDLVKYGRHMLSRSYPDEFLRKLLEGLPPRSAVFIALEAHEYFCAECSS